MINKMLKSWNVEKAWSMGGSTMQALLPGKGLGTK